ncbi:hypothetical protein G6F68_014441 [Rhizopus microsporus]|nr:hypothetical protein G6F68_014441 [Rhizopus microsporus]
MGDSAAHSHSRPREKSPPRPDQPRHRSLARQWHPARRLPAAGLRGRAPEDPRPRRLRHQRRHAAGQGRAQQSARTGTGAGRGAAAQRGREQGRDRRPWLHQLPPGPGRVPARSRVGDQGRP